MTVHTGLLLIAIGIAIEIERGTGIGTGIAIAIEGRTHLAAADDTKNPTHKTTAAIPLPRVATSGVLIDMDPADIVRAHTNENIPPDTEMTITVTDPLADTDCPTGGTTKKKIQKDAGDTGASARGETAIGTMIEGNTRNHQRTHQVSTTERLCAKEAITGANSGATFTTLRVYTKASTDLGTNLTRCPFLIIL